MYCADCTSVENQQPGTSSKDLLPNYFVPNLTVPTFVNCLPISGGKFAADCCWVILWYKKWPRFSLISTCTITVLVFLNINVVISCFSFDIAEAQMAQMSGCMLTFLFGPEIWQHKVREKTITGVVW